MYKRLIEYDEIGIDKTKRETKELDFACNKLRYLIEVLKCGTK